jgi:hypothetical protein
MPQVIKYVIPGDEPPGNGRGDRLAVAALIIALGKLPDRPASAAAVITIGAVFLPVELISKTKLVQNGLQCPNGIFIAGSTP